MTKYSSSQEDVLLKKSHTESCGVNESYMTYNGYWSINSLSINFELEVEVHLSKHKKCLHGTQFGSLCYMKFAAQLSGGEEEENVAAVAGGSGGIQAAHGGVWVCDLHLVVFPQHVGSMERFINEGIFLINFVCTSYYPLVLPWPTWSGDRVYKKITIVLALFTSLKQVPCCIESPMHQMV